MQLGAGTFVVAKNKPRKSLNGSKLAAYYAWHHRGNFGTYTSVCIGVWRGWWGVGEQGGRMSTGDEEKSSAVCIHNKYQATAMIIHNEWHYQSENIIMMI